MIDPRPIRSWLAQTARPLDAAYVSWRLGDGATDEVVEELARFQNADGGFGNGIEPDLPLPDSTALATSVALQYLSSLQAPAGQAVVQGAITWLTNAFDPGRSGWPIVVPAVDDHPHAPWWGYEGAMAGFGWGNPSAEILGYLIEFRGNETDGLVEKLTARALARLLELAETREPDFHELLCFKRLFEQAGDELKIHMEEPLRNLILAAVSVDPGEWGGYVCTPLTFVQAPDDPFTELFDQSALEANLDHIERAISGDHWEPTWDWGDAYPDAWEIARREWAGKITADNLVILRAFGRLKPAQ